MWNLFGRYKGRKVLPSARQMNLIAAILNHVTQGTGIKMDMPQLPSTDSPWTIGIDVDWLKDFVGGDVDVAANKIVKTDADGDLDALCDVLTSAPSSDKVLTVKSGGTVVAWEDANDHEHTTDDITDWDTATSNFLDTSDIGVNVAAYSHTHSEYAANNHTHNGYASAGHTHAYSQLTGTPDLSGFLDTFDIGDTVQAYSSSLTALESNLTSDGKVPLSMLTGNISGHSGTCYVTIDNYGNLGHSENLAYDLLNAAKTASASALATDKCLGNGLQYASSAFSVKTRSGYGLTCDANGLALTTLTANKWMKTDANGLPTTTNDTPASFSSTPTSGRVVLTDGTTGALTTASGGYSGTKTVVTGVTWNGTQLVITRENWTYSGGIVTTAAATSNVTINTVTY